MSSAASTRGVKRKREERSNGNDVDLIGDSLQQPIIMSRRWAMPNKATFTIKPMKEIIEAYVPASGKGWADPFAGKNSVAEFQNDLNKTIKKKNMQHKDAL